MFPQPSVIPLSGWKCGPRVVAACELQLLLLLPRQLLLLLL
jgi:hypothetical protein